MPTNKEENKEKGFFDEGDMSKPEAGTIGKCTVSVIMLTLSLLNVLQI